MLARLQQFLTVGLLTLAVGWLVWFYRSAPVLAVSGFLTIALGYIGLLGVEFLLLKRINQSDPAPRATAAELLSAWLGESLIAPRIFCWRQPFREDAVADNFASASTIKGQRGVVLIHGFFCNRGFWNPWLERLQRSGHAFVALSLEPVFGSIDDYTAQIDAAVRKITAATGLPPLLVCHSMGGLAARAWLQSMQADDRVHHVVTIGTPHRGTWLALFSRSLNGQQMRLNAKWHADLDHDAPSHRTSRFTCWYSNADNIVFPTSNATLPGANNQLIRGKAHVQMAFAPQVVNETLALLSRSR